MKRIDIYTSQLIDKGKAKPRMRFLVFLAVMLLIAVSGIIELCLFVSKRLYRLVEKKYIQRSLAFVLAALIFMPIFNPVATFALEEDVLDDVTEIIGDVIVPDDDVPDGEDPDVPPVEDPDAPPVEDPDAPPTEDLNGEIAEDILQAPVMMLFGTSMPAETTGEINTAAEFKRFLDNPGSFPERVYLAADINMSTISFPVNYVPNNLSGTLDGCGHTISGLNMNLSGANRAAMFKSVTGTIKNLGVKNCQFTSTSAKSSCSVFACEGGSGSVTNCFVISNTISAQNGYYGIFYSYFQSGTSVSVSNCYYANNSTSGARQLAASDVNGVGSAVSLSAASSQSTVDATITNLNNNVIGDLCEWYHDSYPTTKNSGYPSFNPTYKVVFMKNTSSSDRTTPYSSADTGTNVIKFGTKDPESYYADISGQKLVAPDSNPSVPRYNFLGWSTTYLNGDLWDYDTDTLPDAIPDGDFTLYAQWEFCPTYTADFYSYDISSDTYSQVGTTSSETNSGSPIAELERPSTPSAVAGYHFDGWFIGTQDNEGTVTLTTTEWTPATSTITNAQYEAMVESGEITHGDIASISIYQKWSPVVYAVTLNTNGGTISNDYTLTSPIEYTVLDSGITFPTQAQMTKVGYTFDEWKITSSDSALLTNGTAISSLSSSAMANLTLTAQWTANSYTVVYNANNGTGMMTNSNHTYGTSAALTANTFTKTYYTFAGWTTESDGSGTFYSNTQSVSNLTSENNGTVNLYAKWTPIDYDINYLEQVSTSRVGTITHTNPTGFNVEDSTIVLTAPTRTGYTFVGWYSDDACTSEITQIDTSTGRDVNVYSKWTPITYNIEYRYDGGALVSPYSPPATYTIETAGITLPSGTQLTKSHYDILRWAITNDETGSYSSTNTLSVPANTYGNLTAIVTWTPTPYTITYDIDANVTNYSGAPNSYTYASTIILGTPTKTGYTFTGWTVSYPSGGSGSFTTGETVTIIENDYGDIFLKANWTLKEVSISLIDSEDDSTIDTITQNYQTMVSAPANPTKTGYDFAGWYADEELQTPFTFPIASMPADDFSVYAKWTIKSYSVDFNTDGATAVSSQTIEYNSYAERPTTIPTKTPTSTTGYYFAGWYTDNTYTTPFDFDNTAITDNKTIYAKIQSYSLADPPSQYSLYYKEQRSALNVIEVGDYFEGEQLVLPDLPDDLSINRIFNGWVSEDFDDPTALYAGASIITMPDKNVTLIGQWTSPQYTVTFDSAGGSAVTSQQVYYNDFAVSQPPTYDRHIFEGWFIGDTEFEFDTTPITADITLTAHWREVAISTSPSGSSDYTKTIRVTEIPTGFTNAGMITASMDLSDVDTSIDVRINTMSESDFEKLVELLGEDYNISEEDIVPLDISLYKRGTNTLFKLSDGQTVTYRFTVPDKFTDNLEKIKVVSINGEALDFHSVTFKQVNNVLTFTFSSSHNSPYAIILDRSSVIVPEDFSASASVGFTEIPMEQTRNIQTGGVNTLVPDRKRSIFSRKKKRYVVVRKFH